MHLFCATGVQDVLKGTKEAVQDKCGSFSLCNCTVLMHQWRKTVIIIISLGLFHFLICSFMPWCILEITLVNVFS